MKHHHLRHPLSAKAAAADAPPQTPPPTSMWQAAWAWQACLHGRQRCSHHRSCASWHQMISHLSLRGRGCMTSRGGDQLQSCLLSLIAHLLGDWPQLQSPPRGRGWRCEVWCELSLLLQSLRSSCLSFLLLHLPLLSLLSWPTWLLQWTYSLWCGCCTCPVWLLTRLLLLPPLTLRQWKQGRLLPHLSSCTLHPHRTMHVCHWTTIFDLLHRMMMQHSCMLKRLAIVGRLKSISHVGCRIHRGADKHVQLCVDDGHHYGGVCIVGLHRNSLNSTCTTISNLEANHILPQCVFYRTDTLMTERVI